jgi:tetratricopeptide (TPR) repeat protein
MTRRARRVTQLAAIAGATVLAIGGSAGAYPPSEPPLDLSHLEFVPALPAGALAPSTAAGARAVAPEPVKVDRAQLDRAIGEQLDAIHAEEVGNGTFSKDLAPELLSLAVLYQQRGDHILAIPALERARQIIRYNEGLYSLDQVPMVERTLASRDVLHEGSGQPVEEDTLLELARRNPGDARVADIYYELANRHLGNVERYLADPSQQELAVTLNVDGLAPHRESPEETALSTLDDARDNYADAIRSVVRHRSPDGPSLNDVEAGLVRSYYIEAQNVGKLSPLAAQTSSRLGKPRYQEGIRAALHERGVESYGRRMRFSVKANRPDREIAAEQLELGDWHLLFDDNELAFATYRNARLLLERDGATPEELQRFFSPISPTVLPTFISAFVPADQAAAYRGYIDVAITLNGVGKSARFDVTGKSAGTPDEVVHRLKHYVAESRFRPRFEGDGWVPEEHVAMRYYFVY